MVATKRPQDVLPYSTGDEQGLVYRFAAPALPYPPSAPRRRGAPVTLEPTDPERFDGFTLMLYVALAVGLLLVAGLAYIVFLPPTSVMLP